MALKKDLTDFFNSNDGDIKTVAIELVKIYENNIKKSLDISGNKWTNVNYDIIRESIEKQLNKSLSTNSYLSFELIEQGLISAWSSATLILPAIPVPPLLIILNGTITTSTLPKITPLVSSSDSVNNIVDKFYNLFVNHAKSLNYIYSGTDVSGLPFSIPLVGLTIK